MFVPFQALKPSSRIWIYQSNRKFTEPEKTIIVQQLQLFTEKWAAHGHLLTASFDIRYDQFILLAADESGNGASGCSIDDSVRTIDTIGKQIGVDLFNRNLVAFKKNESIVLIPLAELKEKYQEGLWNESTLAFNNLIQTKEQLENGWLVPSEHTWLKRYVPVQKVAR
jgi:hypothetical protein